MEKPDRLYHASADRTITRIEPRADSIRNSAEGPRVFATPDKRMASLFIAGTDDSWTRKGVFGHVPYIVISDKERFEQLDRGGAIYHVPGVTFETDSTKGLGELEWTSREPVEPIGKDEHESALDAMIEHGVQVYFVDTKTFEAIDAANDHGLAILRLLESENQRRGVNSAEL